MIEQVRKEYDLIVASVVSKDDLVTLAKKAPGAAIYHVHSHGQSHCVSLRESDFCADDHEYMKALGRYISPRGMFFLLSCDSGQGLAPKLEKYSGRAVTASKDSHDSFILTSAVPFDGDFISYENVPFFDPDEKRLLNYKKVPAYKTKR
jgi:hypothetical protein